jgi:MFS family permease
MTALERRSAFSLASIYALRMLGLFMVLPVFSLEARHYQGGDNEVAIGLAIGMYGLVQACLQIPFGLAADRFGRKRVILLGLGLLALGSAIAALADSVQLLAIGRGIQGGGAISAAVSALLADQTRTQVRTKGMALIGASIGLMFALSLGVGPVLNLWGGLPLIFWSTFGLSIAGMAVILYWTPEEDHTLLKKAPLSGSQTRSLVFSQDLLKLDYGVFILYAVQLATWMALPALLIQAGVEKSNHGWFYLPAVLLSFVVMGGTLFPMERKGHLKPLFLSSIVLVFLVQFGFIYESTHTPDVWVLEMLVFLFFCGFNILEASQPSLASKIAPPQARGAALGVYNTLQSLGIFAGGAVGGWLAKTYSSTGLFLVCSALLLSWVVVSWRMNYANHAQVTPT